MSSVLVGRHTVITDEYSVRLEADYKTFLQPRNKFWCKWVRVSVAFHVSAPEISLFWTFPDVPLSTKKHINKQTRTFPVWLAVWIISGAYHRLGGLNPPNIWGAEPKNRCMVSEWSVRYAPSPQIISLGAAYGVNNHIFLSWNHVRILRILSTSSVTFKRTWCVFWWIEKKDTVHFPMLVITSL